MASEIPQTDEPAAFAPQDLPQPPARGEAPAPVVADDAIPEGAAHGGETLHSARAETDEPVTAPANATPAADAVLEGGVSDAVLARSHPEPSQTAASTPSRASLALAACVAGLIGGGLVLALERALRDDGRAGLAAQTRRITDLETQFSSLEQKVRTASADPAAAASAPAPPDPALAQRIAALEQKATASPPPDAAPPAPAPAVSPPDFGPVQTRLDGLDRRSEDLARQIEQAAAAAAQAREAAAQTEAKARADAKAATDPLLSRLGSAEQKLDAVAAQQGVLRGAPALAVLTALRASLEAGRPLGPQLAALEGLGVAPEKLAALKAVSAGSPDGRALADQLASLKDRLAAPALPSDAGAGARLLAHATSLVKVTPAGDASGEGALAIASRAEAALRREALPAAKAELDRLPAETRPVVAGVTDALAKRLAAKDAVAALEADAFGAIAAARPRS